MGIWLALRVTVYRSNHPKPQEYPERLGWHGILGRLHLGVGVVAGGQDCHEHRRLLDLACFRVRDRQRHPGNPLP